MSGFLQAPQTPFNVTPQAQTGTMPGDALSALQTPPPDDGKMVDREAPNPPEARRKLVKRWCARVTEARRHWKDDFKRMRFNMDFVEGRQWSGSEHAALTDGKSGPKRDDRYVANVAIRHVQQRTAELYPTNPTVKAKPRQRMLAATWDGTQAQAMESQQKLLGAVQMGMPPDPQALAVLQDMQMVKQYDQLMDRIGKTLELLYEYNVDEQNHPFKSMMKMTVRRAIVTGVGYVKLGFQRAMEMAPEIEARIADMSEQLANIERLSADMADNEIEKDSADAEELRLAIKALTEQGQIIVREGLAFDYPDSTAIIMDPKCRSLRGFLGADWVAQQYLLTEDEIQEVYGVDIGSRFHPYDSEGGIFGAASTGAGHYEAGGGGAGSATAKDDGAAETRGCVWEIYNRKDGLVYVACDGYPDFLIEPAAPEAPTQRFWPWFAFVINEGYDDRALFPQSDIDLIRDMQLELNRARQGLREHRRANRPKIAVAAGILEQPDLDKLKTHPANALLELNALSPGQKIDDVLQVMKMPPIDPAVYDTSPVFEDILRVLGSDQADQGTTSGATATEVSVAQFSQHSDIDSVTDDMNDMLTDMARSAGEILLLNVSQGVVQQVLGPGAVWPQLDKETIAKNIYLEIDAAANGPPNKQQAIQNFVQIVPLLQRIPGLSPEWMARELIRRLDDKIDMSEAFTEGMPSMEALNQLMAQPPPGAGAPAPDKGEGPPGGAGKGNPRPSDPGADPNAQGPAGLANSMNGPSTAGGLGPRVPPLQVYGANGNRPGTGGGMPRMKQSSEGMATP